MHPFAPDYDLYQPATIPIIEVLNTVGIDERDITAIVTSNLHFDHCGQNNALPSVPVYVQSAELAAAEQPHYTIAEWAHVEPEKRRIIDGDEEIAFHRSFMNDLEAAFQGALPGPSRSSTSTESCGTVLADASLVNNVSCVSGCPGTPRVITHPRSINTSRPRSRW